MWLVVGLLKSKGEWRKGNWANLWPKWRILWIESLTTNVLSMFTWKYILKGDGYGVGFWTPGIPQEKYDSLVVQSVLLVCWLYEKLHGRIQMRESRIEWQGFPCKSIQSILYWLDSRNRSLERSLPPQAASTLFSYDYPLSEWRCLQRKSSIQPESSVRYFWLQTYIHNHPATRQ